MLANCRVSPGTAASPCRIICVNRAGTVPPVSADLRATAAMILWGELEYDAEPPPLPGEVA